MSNLTLEIAEQVVEIIENTFGEKVEIHEDYSGRAMYGSTCVAFSGGGRNSKFSIMMIGYAFGILEARRENLPYQGWSYAGIMPSRQDSLGLGVIVY